MASGTSGASVGLAVVITGSPATAAVLADVAAKLSVVPTAGSRLLNQHKLVLYDCRCGWQCSALCYMQ